MAWTGFTDEQLMQLKNQDGPAEHDHPRNNQQHRPPQHARVGAPRRMQNNRNMAQRGRGPRPTTKSSPNVETLNPNQMLSKPKQIPNRTASQQRPRPSTTTDEESVQRKGNAKGQVVKNEHMGVNEKGDSSAAKRKQGGVGHDGRDRNGTQQEEEEVENKEVVTEELDEKEGISRELSKMEKFQEEQKKMEAENAKRKALLARAIADRKKKTQAETKRLIYIQKELAKIEDLLTNDVRILRDRIEEVSRTYLEAQKRYQKAEEEFVASKMHLHKMEDMKESLTEHLYTIIHENEVRKAKKLEELVNKLDVDNLQEFEKEIEESQVPQTPSKPVEKQTVHTTDKTAENASSVVIATDTAAADKSPPATSSNSTDHLENSSKTEKAVESQAAEGTTVNQSIEGDVNVNSNKTEKTIESQAVEGTVNKSIEGDVNEESNRGANQKSIPVISTSQENQDLNQNGDEKKEDVGSNVTVPPTVS